MKAALSEASHRGFRHLVDVIRFKALHSLQGHTVIVVVAVTLVIAAVFSMVSLFSVRSSLFDQVKSNSLNDFSNEVTHVRGALNASDISDEAQYQQLINETASSIQNNGTTNLLGVYIFRQTISGDEMTPVSTEPTYGALISSDIRESVLNDEGNSVFYKPVRISSMSGDYEPGAVLGTRLQFGTMGSLELFSLYTYGNEEKSLTQIQRSLLGVCLTLSVFLGVLVMLVLRRIILPITHVADAAETMAAGDLAVRVQVDRKDEIGILQRSFNELAGSLSQKIDELEKAEVAQKRFVSDVSHELRTPITTMRMASELLVARKVSFEPSTKRTVELLSEQIERFRKMLDNLLIISRYDAGSASLDLVESDIRETIRSVVGQVGPIADVNDTQLNVDLPAGLCMIKIDTRRVARILRNLLIDSIDFSLGKPIDIRLAMNRQAAVISIRDHGTGIDKSQLGHIFERFWRGDPSRSRTTGGSGLGLSIALADAKAHHGDIRVRSRLGEGTWFMVVLPLDPAQPEVNNDELPLDFCGEADSFAVRGDFGMATSRQAEA